MIPEAFQTERLRAERLDESHYGELRILHQDAEMMATMGGLRDEASTAAYLERHIAHWREHRFGFWILRDAATGANAGLAGLRQLILDGTETVEAELGYGFRPLYWGRGLATEIASECVRLAFVELGFSSVVALTDPTNVASQRVLGRVGLDFEREVTHENRVFTLFRGFSPGSTR